MAHNKKMPGPDESLKDFFEDREVFAAVFNEFLFHDGDLHVSPETLEEADTAYTEAVEVEEVKIEKVNKYRDIIRRSSIGQLVILGIEDQNAIHYAMPVRKMLYDALSYSAELASIVPTGEKIRWTVDERLSKVSKGTTITPTITIVFYTGEKSWDGPRSLSDMIPKYKKFSPYVPDYPLFLIDVGHDDTLKFENPALKELHQVLTSIYAKTGDTNTTEVSPAILALAGVLANDSVLYKAANQQKGDKVILCEALKERDAIIFADINAKVEKERQEFNLKLAEKDSTIAEKDSTIAEKDSTIAEKDSRIRELEALLAAKS